MARYLVPITLTALKMFDYLHDALPHKNILVAKDYRVGEIWITLPRNGWRLKTKHKNAPHYRQLVKLPDITFCLTWPEENNKYYLYRISADCELTLVEWPTPPPAATE